MASCYISWRLPHSAGGFFHKYRFVDETLSNIMGIILFAFLAVLVHGHPSNLPRDDIGENLFLSSSANIFTDTTLVSSLTPGDSDLGEASSNPFDDSIFTLDLSLADPNAEHTPDLFTDSTPGSDPSINSFDPLVATTSLDLDANLANSNCEDSAMESGEFLAEYDPTEDFSIELFDPSISSAKIKKRIDTLYELDPNTPDSATSDQAYAADGTPLQPAKCPGGKRRVCCIRDAVPPFSQCWFILRNVWACRFIKNKFCCAGVPVLGGAGIDCEDMKWVKARDGRQPRENSFQEPPSNQFQETFPIFQPLPDLNPDPGYCKTGARL